MDSKTKLICIVGASVIALGGIAWYNSAKAADLGTNAIGDLEERVAELEATVAKRGNRKVTLTISGEISKALLWHDIDALAGANKLRVIDNGNSGSKVRLTGESKISPTAKVGFIMEMGYDETRGAGLGPVVSSLVNHAELRKSAIWMETQLGRVTLGKASFATDGITEVDISNSGIASRMLSLEPLWSFIGLNGLPIVGGNLLNPMPFHDLRGDLVRYDSPTLMGFTMSASWGGGQTLTNQSIWDGAIRYANEIEGFKVAAGVGYRMEQYDLLGISNQKTVSGSASVMHTLTGFFVSGSIADQKNNPVFGDIRAYHLKAGWENKVVDWGRTTIYGEWGNHDINATMVSFVPTMNNKFYGAGLVQAFDAAQLDAFLSFRTYTGDVFTTDSHSVMAGGRVRF